MKVTLLVTNALIRICEIYDIMDIILPYQEVILEAAIRGIDEAECARITELNARRVFGIE